MLSIKLKEQTNEIHKSLEELPLLKKVVSPDITKDEYCALLNGFYRLHRIYETGLHNYDGPIISNYEERCKLHLLEEDLNELDMVILERNEQIKFTKEAQVLGAMYVMEGSTLGGQYIVKNLNQVFPEYSHNFYNGYGAETGKYWKEFKTYLDDFEESEHNKVINSAKQMFMTIYNTFGMSGYYK